MQLCVGATERLLGSAPVTRTLHAHTHTHPPQIMAMETKNKNSNKYKPMLPETREMLEVRGEKPGGGVGNVP